MGESLKATFMKEISLLYELKGKTKNVLKIYENSQIKVKDSERIVIVTERIDGSLSEMLYKKKRLDEKKVI